MIFEKNHACLQWFLLEAAVVWQVFSKLWKGGEGGVFLLVLHDLRVEEGGVE